MASSSSLPLFLSQFVSKIMQLQFSIVSTNISSFKKIEWELRTKLGRHFRHLFSSSSLTRISLYGSVSRLDHPLNGSMVFKINMAVFVMFPRGSFKFHQAPMKELVENAVEPLLRRVLAPNSLSPPPKSLIGSKIPKTLFWIANYRRVELQRNRYSNCHLSKNC